MNQTTRKAALGLFLPFLSTAAMAWPMFDDLKAQAGDDAVSRIEKLPPVTTPVLTAAPITPETAARIQGAFRDLKEKGFPGLQWRGLALGVRYVRLPLQLVTCPGCVSYTALVPVGALTPTAPVGDPNKASYFIIERAGEWIKPEARYSSPISLAEHKDVLAGCGLDGMYIRAFTLPEAVSHVQACLDKTYFQHPFARRIYFVSAQAARFDVRACPQTAGITCQAIMEVEGVELSVSGRVPAGDPVLSDLGFSLEQRGGKLLGFHAILSDKTQH